MTKFKSTGILQSVSNALRGLKIVFFSQRNFVIETVISIFVIILGIILKFSITDICILLIISMIVLICELFNTVIEFMLDSVYKNNYSKLVEMAKDISAGMVFFTGILSVIAGIILFGKYIFLEYRY